MDIIGERTILDLLHEKCYMHGDKKFLIFEDVKEQVYSLTYNELLNRVNRFSNVLLKYGVEQGDKILVHLPNCLDFIVSWFSIAQIGAIMVPTNILSSEQELDYIVEHSDSVLVITEENFYNSFLNICKNNPRLKHILLTRCNTNELSHINVDRLIENEKPNKINTKIRSEDPVTMLYTSGTTSKPKGCLITHANYIYTGEIVSKTIRFSPKDRGLIVLPLFHGNAQYYLFMPALVVGGSIVIIEKFSASRYIKQAKKFKVTIGSLFAAPIRMILAQNYEELDYENYLRLVLFAQSVTKKELVEFETRYNTSLLQLYGMTETVVPPLINPLDGIRDNLSIGRPIIGTKVKLVNVKNQVVNVNEIGEIIVKVEPGRTAMAGYYKNEEATSKTIRNGWLYTGDKAMVKENGYYYFVDRAKDLIKTSGENVSSVEVENAIMEHPFVYEAAVIGVPDPIRDEVLKAYIILNENNTVTKEEIILHCQKRLSKFKVPTYVEFVTDFPRTSVGKIQKHLLNKKT